MDCSNGKRGRGNGRGEAAGGAATKKKAKRAVKAAAEVVEEGNNEGFMVVEEMAAAAEVEELWIGVEGMPWATWWLPFWEVETIGDALYEDVVWDYDIWGLKAADTSSISPTI